MDTKKNVLSICVPTYNGGQSIQKCLQSIFSAREKYQDIVEIIVSDNASTDSTYDILQSFDEPNYYVYRNTENIGYNKNLCKLIDNYANGEFVWTIGDDDLISRFSLELFMKYRSEMDILLLRNIGLSGDGIEELEKTRNLEAYKMSYYQAIDRIASGANILATFMSCAIFRRENVKNIDKSEIQESDWNTYSKVFPNGYLLNIGFGKSMKVFYAEDVFVYNVPLQRDWAEKMIHIQTKILPEFYFDICKNRDAYKDLRRTRMIFIKALVKIAIVYSDVNYKRKAIQSLVKILCKRW